MSTAWPRARAVAGDRAVMKAAAEDFRVCELPAASEDVEGDGEHLLLRLEKTGRATIEVARWLADAYGVPEQAVGYAGMKDKHAVTSQWFSVHTPRSAEALPAADGIRMLASSRRRRKLRRGELAGNRFVLRLREVVGDAWPERLQEIRDVGVPNYFGAQRFGTDNLARAEAWLTDRRRRRLPAFRRGLYLSVLRSFLFNEVLAARVTAGSWNRLVEGDVPVDGTGGQAAWPSGPLWGRGRSAAAGAAALVEARAVAPHRAICEGLEHAGLAQERRSLVLHAPDLQWRQEPDAVTLEFTLPPGCYATTLLAEAFELSAPASEAR